MGEPNCENCGHEASGCNCWDDHESVNAHEILAFRLKNELTKSDWLQPKEEVDDED